MDDSKAIESESLWRAAKRGRALLRWLVLFIFILNGAILFKAFVPEQRTYQGKTVAQWLKSKSELKMYAHRWANPEVVNAFGPEVWPELVKAIKQRDSTLVKTYSSLCQELPLKLRNALQRWQPIPAEVINNAAYDWLAQLGPDAREAVPELLSLVLHEKDIVIRSQAFQALRNVGSDSPEVLALLFKLLKEPETLLGQKEMQQEWMLELMTTLGPKAKSVGPLLVESVRMRKHGTPTNEIVALCLIGPEAREAVPVLADALSDPLLRPSALMALAAIGSGVEEAVPQVIEILRKSGSNIKAVEILFRVWPPAKDALPVLREIESRETNVLRVLAALAISRIEAKPQRVSPWVIEALQDQGPGPDPTWFFEVPSTSNSRHLSLPFTPFVTAAWFLGELGTIPESALPTLKEVLTTGNWFMRVLAARALCSAPGPVDPEALNSLAKEINHNNPDCPTDEGFQIALRTLKEMGPKASAAAPALVQFINTKTNWWARRRAVSRVLERVRGASDE